MGEVLRHYEGYSVAVVGGKHTGACVVRVTVNDGPHKGSFCEETVWQNSTRRVSDVVNDLVRELQGVGVGPVVIRDRPYSLFEGRRTR